MRRIPVFFTPHMSASGNDSFSPSAGKPIEVVSDWIANAMPVAIVPVSPASVDTIALAHDPKYVRDVLGCAIDNGFGNRSQAVAATLPYTVGSMVDAAVHVAQQLKRELPAVACSPSSGFHHAGYAFGGGYCTFNGLMVAAMALRKRGLAERVAILDCDFHNGNGTENIIDTLNLHDWIEHRTLGLEVDFWRRRRDKLPLSLSTWVKETCTARHGRKPRPPAVLLYQAGADMHQDDPLGGLLNTSQMRLRDLAVLRTCANYGIAVVWNLAGGYQRDEGGSIRPVLALHRQTMEVCAAVYNGEHP